MSNPLDLYLLFEDGDQEGLLMIKIHVFIIIKATTLLLEAI